MDSKQYICIICPKCCAITFDGNVCTGAGCRRGEAFVAQELKVPQRTLTTTLKCMQGNTVTMVPVKSKETVPLADTTELVARLKTHILETQPPVGSELVLEGVTLIITG